MSLDPAIREQTYHYFLQEAPELLQALEQGLLNLKTDRNINQVNNLMRVTHTLKGAATSVGLETIATVAHSLEDIFKALCQPNVSLQPDVEALLFEGVECLRVPLVAELTGGVINHPEILDRAATIFAQLHAQLGDCFGQVAHLPSSLELGFDVTLSIFEVGVAQRLDEIAAILEQSEPEAIAITLRTQAEVFLGLAESLNLPGFGSIAQTTLAALDRQPDQAKLIAEVALTDFRAGQTAVLAGDRSQGGSVSEKLQHLALALSSTQPAHTNVTSTNITSGEETQDNLTDVLIDNIWGGQAIDLETSLDTSTFDLNSPNPVTSNPVTPNPGTFDSTTPNSITPVPAPSSETSVELPTSVALAHTITPTPTSPRDVEEPAYVLSPSPINATTPQREAARAQIRVNVKYLDQLNYSIGELLTNQNRQFLQTEQLQATVQALFKRLKQHQDLLNQLRHQSKRQNQLFATARHSTTRKAGSKSIHQSIRRGTHDLNALPQDSVSIIQTLLDDMTQLTEVADALDLFTNQTNQTLEQQRQLLTQTRTALIEARMLPLGQILQRLPAVLQQLETLYNKPITLDLKGTEVLVDKAVAEKLYDPLLHLVRNAFDHGIESIALRQQQGKPEIGKIEISAYNQGRYLVIEVQDDGKGIEFDHIRQRALERNLISPEQAFTLSNTQLIDLLFEPGFSTAVQVNDISGRGIGLDVVKTQVQALQGSVSVQTKPGAGTTFLLQIPLNLTIAPLLVCETGSRLYAFLDDAIEQILLPQPGQIQERGSRRVLQWHQEEKKTWIPIHRLSTLLSDPAVATIEEQPTSPGATSAKPIVLIRQQESLHGLEIDHLLGEQELIIRPLSTLLGAPNYVHGASIIADGRLSLVIDAATLIQQATRLSDPQPTNQRWNTVSSTLMLPSAVPQVQRLQPQTASTLPPPPRSPIKPQILVVDDSITTRQNLALVLQKAGYQVFQAQNGQEAIAQLKHQHRIQLVICDLEMPVMNGFEFLRYLQHQTIHSNLPVLMLTSRNDERLSSLALQLGAAAYITKPYLELKLLDTVAKLLIAHC